MSKIWVFAGTFDPITRGHEALIARARPLCDRLIVAVAAHTNKQTLLDGPERLALVQQVLGPTVEARLFSGLLARFCRDQGARTLVRGLRNPVDFAYEQQLAEVNGHLGIETVFLNGRATELVISSSLVKELARLGGDFSPFVSGPVVEKISQKILNHLE